MSNGIDFALKLRIKDITEIKNDDVELFCKNMEKLDNILGQISNEIDISKVREGWCKTCTNADKGYSGIRMTACMGCAMWSPFKQPLNYTGSETDIINVKHNNFIELVKIFNSFIKEEP